MNEIVSLLASVSIITCTCIFLLFKRSNKKVTCKIGKLEWDRNAFCRGWLVTGATGVGKTLSGINLLMDQIFQNEKGIKDKYSNYVEYPWGGICIDEKGTYVNSIAGMAKRYGRERDLYILETKPEGDLADWKPLIRFNLLSEENVTASTFASIIVKTAEAVSGSLEENGFFRTQAQTHILKAIELLRAIKEAQFKLQLSPEKRVNISLKRIHHILCNKNDFKILLREAGIELPQNSRQEFNKFECEGFEEPKAKTFNCENKLKSEKMGMLCEVCQKSNRKKQ